MAVEAQKKTQYGLETVNGTAVAADTMLGMTCTLPEDDREVHVPRVEMGLRMTRYLDAAIVKRLEANGVGLEDSDGIYYQAFPLLFSSSIVGNITPSAGAGDDYTWTFPAPNTGAEALDTFTLEHGDDAGGYEIPYCITKSWTITGDCDGGDANMSAELVGHFVDQTTMTGGLSLPTMTLLQGKRTRVYVDSSWANLGNTELADCLVNWEVAFEGGGHAKHWGSANMEYDGHNQGEILGTCQLVLERNAAVRTEEANYRPAAGGTTVTTRFVRVEVTGPLIVGAVYHTLTLDMAGVWQTWGPIASANNGNTYDAATLMFGYDGTGAQGFQAEVITNVATI